MTRFDADESDQRRALFADAVRAHRERDSPFLTIEPEPTPAEAADTEDRPPDAPEHSVPWIQLADETVNLDCTDGELAALKSLLDDYPAFRIDELTSPEDAHGTNVRITARADPARLADFFDRAFRAVYGRDEDYRAWVVAV